MFRNTKAFASFSVSDLASAKSFYADTLGLVVKETLEGLELHLAGGGMPVSFIRRTTTTLPSTRY